MAQSGAQARAAAAAAANQAPGQQPAGLQHGTGHSIEQHVYSTARTAQQSAAPARSTAWHSTAQHGLRAGTFQAQVGPALSQQHQRLPCAPHGGHVLGTGLLGGAGRVDVAAEGQQGLAAQGAGGQAGWEGRGRGRGREKQADGGAWRGKEVSRLRPARGQARPPVAPDLQGRQRWAGQPAASRAHAARLLSRCQAVRPRTPALTLMLSTWFRHAASASKLCPLHRPSATRRPERPREAISWGLMRPRGWSSAAQPAASSGWMRCTWPWLHAWRMGGRG